MSPPPRHAMFNNQGLVILGASPSTQQRLPSGIAGLPYSTGIKQYLLHCISLVFQLTHSLNFPQLPNDFTNQGSHK
jgi:hypothetical protein